MAASASASPDRGRAARLPGSAFERLFQHGKPVAGRLLVVRASPNDAGLTRWGFAVSRRTAPTAVLRNRTRRRLRAAARETPDPGARDIVVLARPPAVRAPVATLRAELRRLIARLNGEDA